MGKKKASGRTSTRPKVQPVVAPPSVTDPIKHVIVLTLENRSFDQMLGALQAVYPDLDGVPTGGHPRENFVGGEPAYQQLPMEYTITFPDPMHELENVRLQIGQENAYFVLDYLRSYPDTSREQREQIMTYYPLDFLEATHTLARHFTICDQWFSSLPGPTWPNRFFLLSGTSRGHVKMPVDVFRPNLHWYDQTTIFDRLDEAKITWRIYHGDFPLSLLLVHQLKSENLARYRDLDRFAEDASVPEREFPQFVFIEPDYLGDDANDDHPPHDVIKGEQLIADVYNALRANNDLWRSSLLVLLFDEHGGFYDHVTPPSDAEPPDEYDDDFDFRQLGLRVPALLISPWVANVVAKTRFDHTSLLKYLVEKWTLGDLGKRTAAAESFAPFVRRAGGPRTDTPERLEVRRPLGTPPSTRLLTANEQSIVLLTEQLSSRSLADQHGAVHRVARAMANSPKVRDDVRAQLTQFLARHTDPR